MQERWDYYYNWPLSIVVIRPSHHNSFTVRISAKLESIDAEVVFFELFKNQIKNAALLAIYSIATPF